MGFHYAERFTYADGAAAIDHTITSIGTMELKEVRLHLTQSGGSSEDFTVTLNSNEGAEHDTVLATQDMNAVTDYVFRASPTAFIAKGDLITFNYANSNTKTWGLEVIYKGGGAATDLAG